MQKPWFTTSQRRTFGPTAALLCPAAQLQLIGAGLRLCTPLLFLILHSFEHLGVFETHFHLRRR